jgi:hypothetical protein
VELKNMNSFRYVQHALEYEAARQEALLQEGGAIVQETRLFDPKAGATHSMRRKEEAHDYRYFPEPDLVPLVVDPAWVAELRASLPELPAAKRRRYVEPRPARIRRGRPHGRPGAGGLVRGRPRRVPPAEDRQQLGHGRAAATAAGRRPRRARLPGASGRARRARGGRGGTITRAWRGPFETMFREGRGAAAVIERRG